MWVGLIQSVESLKKTEVLWVGGDSAPRLPWIVAATLTLTWVSRLPAALQTSDLTSLHNSAGQLAINLSHIYMHKIHTHTQYIYKHVCITTYTHTNILLVLFLWRNSIPWLIWYLSIQIFKNIYELTAESEKSSETKWCYESREKTNTRVALWPGKTCWH